jgi:hypothetical protein
LTDRYPDNIYFLSLKRSWISHLHQASGLRISIKSLHIRGFPRTKPFLSLEPSQHTHTTHFVTVRNFTLCVPCDAKDLGFSVLGRLQSCGIFQTRIFPVRKSVEKVCHGPRFLLSPPTTSLCPRTWFMEAPCSLSLSIAASLPSQ